MNWKIFGVAVSTILFQSFDYTVEIGSLESADSTTQGFGDWDSMVKRVKR